MKAKYQPPFTLRFGDFKRIWHQKKGVPEPPSTLLVMDFSNYVSADTFTGPDFDENLMLNQIQLMSLHCQENLLYSTVEDLKLAAQQWLWNPLGLEVPTSQFVLVTLPWILTGMVVKWFYISMTLGRKCLLCGKSLNPYILNFELWHKFDIPFRPPHPLTDQDKYDLRPPALRLRELQTQERLRHNFEVSL